MSYVLKIRVDEERGIGDAWEVRVLKGDGEWR